jgi:hypothetical protein
MVTPPIKLWKALLGSLVLLAGAYYWGRAGGSRLFHNGSIFAVDQVESGMKNCLNVYAFPSRSDGPR